MDDVGSGIKINSYKTDSKYAEEQERWLDNYYQNRFSDLVAIQRVRDKERQIRGVDLILVFPGNMSVNIDEKVRRKKYDDFFLEEYSNVKTKRPGWIIKEGSLTDYIVYAFEDTKEVYFLPYLLLRQAWFDNFFEWQASYDRKEAVNEEGYITSGLVVPIREVYRAIWQCCKGIA